MSYIIIPSSAPSFQTQQRVSLPALYISPQNMKQPIQSQLISLTQRGVGFTSPSRQIHITQSSSFLPPNAFTKLQPAHSLVLQKPIISPKISLVPQQQVISPPSCILQKDNFRLSQQGFQSIGNSPIKTPSIIVNPKSYQSQHASSFKSVSSASSSVNSSHKKDDYAKSVNTFQSPVKQSNQSISNVQIQPYLFQSLPNIDYSSTHRSGSILNSDSELLNSCNFCSERQYNSHPPKDEDIMAQLQKYKVNSNSTSKVQPKQYKMHSNEQTFRNAYEYQDDPQQKELHSNQQSILKPRQYLQVPKSNDKKQLSSNSKNSNFLNQYQKDNTHSSGNVKQNQQIVSTAGSLLYNSQSSQSSEKALIEIVNKYLNARGSSQSTPTRNFQSEVSSSHHVILDKEEWLKAQRQEMQGHSYYLSMSTGNGLNQQRQQRGEPQLEQQQQYLLKSSFPNIYSQSQYNSQDEFYNSKSDTLLKSDDSDVIFTSNSQRNSQNVPKIQEMEVIEEVKRVKNKVSSKNKNSTIKKKAQQPLPQQQQKQQQLKNKNDQQKQKQEQLQQKVNEDTPIFSSNLYYQQLEQKIISQNTQISMPTSSSNREIGVQLPQSTKKVSPRIELDNQSNPQNEFQHQSRLNNNDDNENEVDYLNQQIQQQHQLEYQNQMQLHQQQQQQYQQQQSYQYQFEENDVADKNEEYQMNDYLDPLSKQQQQDFEEDFKQPLNQQSKPSFQQTSPFERQQNHQSYNIQPSPKHQQRIEDPTQTNNNNNYISNSNNYNDQANHSNNNHSNDNNLNNHNNAIEVQHADYRIRQSNNYLLKYQGQEEDTVLEANKSDSDSIQNMKLLQSKSNEVKKEIILQAQIVKEKLLQMQAEIDIYKQATAFEQRNIDEAQTTYNNQHYLQGQYMPSDLNTYSNSNNQYNNQKNNYQQYQQQYQLDNSARSLENNATSSVNEQSGEQNQNDIGQFSECNNSNTIQLPSSASQQQQQQNKQYIWIETQQPPPIEYVEKKRLQEQLDSISEEEQMSRSSIENANRQNSSPANNDNVTFSPRKYNFFLQNQSQQQQQSPSINNNFRDEQSESSYKKQKQNGNELFDGRIEGIELKQNNQNQILFSVGSYENILEICPSLNTAPKLTDHLNQQQQQQPSLHSRNLSDNSTNFLFQSFDNTDTLRKSIASCHTRFISDIEEEQKQELIKVLPTEGQKQVAQPQNSHILIEENKLIAGEQEEDKVKSHKVEKVVSISDQTIDIKDNQSQENNTQNEQQSTIASSITSQQSVLKLETVVAQESNVTKMNSDKPEDQTTLTQQSNSNDQSSNLKENPNPTIKKNSNGKSKLKLKEVLILIILTLLVFGIGVCFISFIQSSTSPSNYINQEVSNGPQDVGSYLNIQNISSQQQVKIVKHHHFYEEQDVDENDYFDTEKVCKIDEEEISKYHFIKNSDYIDDFIDECSSCINANEFHQPKALCFLKNKKNIQQQQQEDDDDINGDIDQ